jgi:hypothetical protein
MAGDGNLVKKLGMLRDFFLSYLINDYKYDYWHFPHLVSDCIAAGDYFIDFRPKTDYPGPFDSNKIPLLDLTTQHSEGRSGIVYNPIVISQYGLGWYSKYLRNQQQPFLDNFLRIADWLVNNSQELNINGEKCSVLYFDYYGDGKVCSAMAQGQAISVLCRAYRITQNRAYLKKAIELYAVLKRSIKEGGVVDTSLGFPVLEEYSHEPIHILNGHLFALVGIIDLKNIGNLEQEKDDILNSYELYLDSSLKLARKMDMGFWTKYSCQSGLLPNIASHFYHSLHIEMMKGLYALTGIDEFKFCGERWLEQRKKTAYKFLAMILKLMDRLRYSVNL